ncbi:MAG: hypothetical protein MZV70_46335 [Desulfobacterales bacterium]|nr:hypothetical protein [Desulfobacterales bacterium]
MDYSWPGNVRELKSALEYAFVVAETGKLDVEHLPPQFAPGFVVAAGSLAAAEDPPEKNALIEALRRTNGNQTQAARLLGINRVTVWNRMRKYGIGHKNKVTAGTDFCSFVPPDSAQTGDAMRFRWKLLLLMLAVSILPMVFLRAFRIPQRSQHGGGAVGGNPNPDAWGRLGTKSQTLRNGSPRGLEHGTRARCHGLVFPVRSSRPGTHLQKEEDSALPRRAFDAVVSSVAPDVSCSRLCVTAPELETFMKHGAEPLGSRSPKPHLRLLQSIWKWSFARTLPSRAVYRSLLPLPAPGSSFGDVTQEDWYRTAFEESVFRGLGRFGTTPPAWAVSISALREDDDEQPMGAASITVVLDRLLETLLAFSNLPGRTRAFLCMLDQNPAAGAIRLRVLLESNAPTANPIGCRCRKPGSPPM